MTQRFVVRSGDGQTLAELLDRAHIDKTALDDGRVFVGERRATDPNLSLAVGDEVFVAKRTELAHRTTLLGREGDILAFLKPAGLPTVPDRRGNASLLHSAARELGLKATELHVVTRLDTNVSGIVVLATGEEGTRRAAALQAEGRLVRRYLGLSSRAPAPPAGIWNRPIPLKPRTSSRSGRSEMRAAETAYRVVAESRSSSGGRPALLAFQPLTGRTHQIRVHASGAGAPLLGDAAYGGDRRIAVESGTVLDIRRVALHACRVEVISDTCGFRVDAPHPDDLVALWLRFGGDAGAFDLAKSLPMEDA
jgi:23S rRNA-/tRNA-specific pseudouridylate synthase